MSTRISILILLVLTALLFPLLYHFAVAAGGAGHGTTLFYDGLLSPFSVVRLPFVHDYRGYIVLAFLFWVSVAVLVAFRRHRASRYVLFALLAAHYIGVAVRCSQEDWSYGLPRVWQAFPGMVVSFVIAYFVCQFAIWFVTLRKHEAHT